MHAMTKRGLLVTCPRSEEHGYGEQSQPVSIGDADGNRTGDGTFLYTHDPKNRMLTASNTASGGTVNAAYAYDPLGRNVSRDSTV
jgi:hypothetical protein